MENFRIESLEINKIGAFEHLKIDFPKKKDSEKAEIHILTGENGTGKSTVLEALSSLGYTSRDEKGRKIFEKRTGSIEESNLEINTSDGFSQKSWVNRGQSQEPMPPKLVKLFRYAPNSFDSKPLDFFMFAYSGYRRTQEVTISGIREINDSPLLNCLDFDISINTTNLHQWIFNADYRMLSAIRSQNDDLAKSIYKPITLIQAILTKIIDEDLILEISPETFSLNVLISHNKASERIIPFKHLPDGLKSMISWIGDLLMRMDRVKCENDIDIFERNFILFLDEIEVHLHPAWQRKILPIVQKLFKNAQIFISTHSPFVVGSVDGAWVHKFKKGGAYAVLDGEPILSEDGKSVRRILDEIFGIDEQYGVDVEKDLEIFRTYRQQIMMGQKYDVEEFNKLVKHLASQSTELEHLIGMEMNQLKRITQKELV